MKPGKSKFKMLGALLLAALLSMLPFVSSSAEKETLRAASFVTPGEVEAVVSSIPEGWPEAPLISAEAAILIDASSEEILYARNATKAMYPASTTKLMTALLTIENSSLQDVVDFPFQATNIPSGSSHIGMRRGEQMMLEECLYGLLLPSANEVANALALHVSGDMDAFVSLMNVRANQLGMVNTYFANPNGLHDPEHYTCAYDLALLMKACAQNAVFTEISGTQSYVHHADELLPKDIPMTNTHMMLRSSSEFYNRDVICGKTGHTEQSGYNLVTCAERNGVRLVAVVLGCESGNQYVSTQSLLDYGFNYFHPVLPAELDSSLRMENVFTSSPLSLPVPEGALVSVSRSDTVLVPANVEFKDLEKSISKEGNQIRITYTYQGYPLGSATLTIGAEKENDPAFMEKTPEPLEHAETDQLAVIDGWLLVIAAGLLLALVLFIALLSHWILPKKKIKQYPGRHNL